MGPESHEGRLGHAPAVGFGVGRFSVPVPAHESQYVQRFGGFSGVIDPQGRYLQVRTVPEVPGTE